MSMAVIAPRSWGFVCRSCQLAQFKTPTRSVASTALFERSPRGRATASIRPPRNTQRRQVHTATATLPSSTKARSSRLPKATSTSKFSKTIDSNPMQTLSSLRGQVSQITNTHVVPDEIVVLEVLNRILEFSNVIVFGQSEAPNEAEFDEGNSDTSTVLDDLDETSATRHQKDVSNGTAAGAMSLSFRNKAADTLCDLIYTLVRDPKIFISLTILQVYTRVQCLLGKPEYLPHIFHLYANKPKPIEKSSPIKYKNPWPNAPKNAIPLDLADAALECAIQKKDMPLAIAIIDTTVATRAFKLNKLIRKGTLPVLALSATPVIAYAGAKWLSTYQNVWDEDMALTTTMAGSVAYIGTLATVGFVAITTWNDQMQRVTWAIGTGMTQRWLREEERAYFDRVALAWGFQERWRRGEEQGEEWENLRELLGLRSMILDKTELMDGME